MRKSTSTCATLAFAVGKDMGVNFRKHTFEVPGSDGDGNVGSGGVAGGV